MARAGSLIKERNMKDFKLWEHSYILPLLLVLTIAIAACGPEADEPPAPDDEIGVLPEDPLPPVEVDPTVVVEPTVDVADVNPTVVMDPTVDVEDVDLTPTVDVMETETPLPEVTEPADVITGTPEAMPRDERVALVRSDDLVGANIINRADEVIARVEDVLFDEDGNIQYVILSVEDDTGQTTAQDYPYYAIEWDDFAISLADDVAQTNPQTGFEAGELLYEDDTIDLTAAVGIEDEVLEADDIFYTADADVDTHMLDGLFRLSAFANFRLISPDLVNPESDEDLGVVADMLVNMDEGVVQYTVAEIGGWLGIGRTAVIIPWERLTYDEDEEQFLIEATEEELENAPALDVDELDDWEIDPDWEREVEEYWTALDAS
jgi:sporulation protein YlmC with PRC-barrel domain